MKELNKLTQRLFAEGYTKDRHPDYVDDWTYQSEFYGGFEYSRAKKNSMVFSTLRVAHSGILLEQRHYVLHGCYLVYGE